MGNQRPEAARTPFWEYAADSNRKLMGAVSIFSAAVELFNILRPFEPER